MVRPPRQATAVAIRPDPGVQGVPISNRPAVGLAGTSEIARFEQRQHPAGPEPLAAIGRRLDEGGDRAPAVEQLAQLDQALDLEPQGLYLFYFQPTNGGLPQNTTSCSFLPG